MPLGHRNRHHGCHGYWRYTPQSSTDPGEGTSTDRRDSGKKCQDIFLGSAPPERLTYGTKNCVCIVCGRLSPGFSSCCFACCRRWCRRIKNAATENITSRITEPTTPVEYAGQIQLLLVIKALGRTADNSPDSHSHPNCRIRIFHGARTEGGLLRGAGAGAGATRGVFL